MILLIVFAFLGGIVTILSPCILPILPVVLSSSVGGGKRRPLGVVTGFVLSFTFFTLFLSSIVKAIGIEADVLRTVSIVVIAAFGLSFLIPQFQLALERLFSRLAALSPKTGTAQGFGGGVLIGLSLGLVWTPCVGPILASIISLALSGTVGGAAVFVTLAYSLGTAVPMFAIMYGGRELLQRNRWLVVNTVKIQKAFGVVMILTAIAIYSNVDRKFQAFIVEKFPQYGAGLTKFEQNEAIKQQLDRLKGKEVDKKDLEKPLFNFLNPGQDKTTLDNFGQAPELIQGGQWFNLPAGKQAQTLAELRGKVVLIDFWTYTCINCIRTLPYVRGWHEKYKDKGLVIIGVHTPEFEFEKKPENLQKAINDFRLTYPIMQDNDYATWNAYNNRYWPAKYLIDSEGNIRYTHFGEGEYETTEMNIKKLLEEAGKKVDEQTLDQQDETPRGRLTPETYLGSLRMDRFASVEQVKGGLQKFTQANGLPDHYFAYAGTWDVQEEYAASTKGSALDLHFISKKVFLVITPISNDQITIKLDGKIIGPNAAGKDVLNGAIQIDTSRLYELVNLDKIEDHILRLEFQTPGTRIFAFTFG